VSELIQPPIPCEVSRLVPSRFLVAEARQWSLPVHSALEAFCAGKVELGQRRLTRGANDKLPGTFQYIAQKRRVIEKPTVLGVPWAAKLRGPYSDGGAAY
jgi:hypothetical protein